MKPLQASKWLKTPALIETEEMVNLFEALGSVKLYMTGCVTPEGGGELFLHDFFDYYHSYICALREGRKPDLSEYRQPFSCAVTTSDDALFVMKLDGGKQLMRVCCPVIQMQLHTMALSGGHFLSMVLGKDSMSWGIQFSYPQLFQDPKLGDIVKVDEAFPNTPIFKSLQKWMRSNTVPTPFLVNGVTINAPQRLGKNCFGWINNHPDLGDLHVQER